MSTSNEIVAEELVFERLPNGEYAWLRPELDAAADTTLYVTTDLGHDEARRARAMEACFGPWPTVADVLAPILAARRLAFIKHIVETAEPAA